MAKAAPHFWSQFFNQEKILSEFVVSILQVHRILLVEIVHCFWNLNMSLEFIPISLEIFPDGKHIIHFMFPEKFNSLVDNFLTTIQINRYRYILEAKLMETLVFYKHKKFYDFSTSKLLANFRVFDRFLTIRTTHKEPCIKFSKLFGHPKFFYRHFKKNFSKKSNISVLISCLCSELSFYYNKL
ncbi:valacyclovir hydrolase [Aphis craccivora]|uniref:Valacyclovir hydrolase n=1 Tax=Aphis craccivora TaxID=307492 RepID=A0A6G0WR27_APHCR|nr:valacyclovir hydrolase [Aphis craccivora]